MEEIITLDENVLQDDNRSCKKRKRTFYGITKCWISRRRGRKTSEIRKYLGGEIRRENAYYN